MKKTIAMLAVLTTMVGTACLTEGNPVLYLAVYSAVPDTTYEEQLGISGEIVRTPQRQASILVVTVTGGAITAVDTANLHGLFTVTVPLNTNADNHLSMTARDDTGAETAGTWQRTVVQVDTTS